MSNVLDSSIASVCACIVGLAGCAHPPVPPAPAASAPRISAWADRLGPIRTPVRDCVGEHPDKGAIIIGARRLQTGETAVMTRSRGAGVRVCVHDGEEVVYQKSIVLPKQELEGLPFVTLVGGARPVQTPCMSVRELHWGIRVLGWLSIPHCEEEGNARGAR